MKKLFLILTTALFAAGFASCTDDPEETVNPVVVSEILRALGGNVLVNVPEENFDVNIPADAASWVQINEAESSGKALVLSVDENETGTERSTVVNVTRSGKSTVLATVTIKQSDITLQAGEFVIEEIYFTGTALPETGKPDRWLGDQYIKIRNNSDEDLYADGMMLILSSGLNSGMNSEMIEGKDFRKECCAGNAFYCIPGNGQDVLVKAGELIPNDGEIIAGVASIDPSATRTRGTPRKPISSGTTFRRTRTIWISTTPTCPTSTNGTLRH